MYMMQTRTNTAIRIAFAKNNTSLYWFDLLYGSWDTLISTTGFSRLNAVRHNMQVEIAQTIPESNRLGGALLSNNFKCYYYLNDRGSLA